MCANYEFSRIPGGRFEVFIRHPGGKTVVLVTDQPPVLPRRFTEIPRPGLEIAEAPAMFPKYQGPVIRSQGSKVIAQMMQWGFTPHWADRPLQNAQAEKLAVSATWRPSFHARRCLVPATAFFEWQSVPGAKRKTKLRIRPLDQAVFCFAGLWQTFPGDDAAPRDCFTIVTTAANDFMRPIHHRMPVILTPEDQARWTDDTNMTGEDLAECLRPYGGPMAAEPA